MHRLRFSKPLLALFCAALAVVALLANPFGLPPPGAKTIAAAVLLIGLWVTEAAPMPAVALLPLPLFPLLGLASVNETAVAYANPVIFLFMGGFFIGLAIEKWNLHRRIALSLVRASGTSGNRIVLGFIMATGAISMWLSNTATTMMMFPIALSVVKVMEENHPHKAGLPNFSLSLMIAIALASNFGGIATPIGTPPNVAYAGFYQSRYGQSLPFAQWVLLCMPLAILLLLALYVVLKMLCPSGMKSDPATRHLIHAEAAALGPWSVAEKRVLVVFACTAALWITKDFWRSAGLAALDDNSIAVLGGCSLFFLPSGQPGQPLLAWSDTRNMAWGILLLFGGGIALATALEKAGLVEQLGAWFGGFGLATLPAIFAVTLFSLFVSEVMSNVAQVIVFAPVVSALAQAAGLDPLQLGLPMTLAASCASMLPMGTPPNAIAFSSGYIKLRDMARVGLVMNLVAVVLITLFCWLLLPVVFG